MVSNPQRRTLTLFPLFSEKRKNKARRSAAEQEVLALIAQLAKLGRFQVPADFFQVDVLQLAYRVGR